MKNSNIGKGIAVAALIAATTWLEISGKQVEGLWLLIVVIFIFGDWD